MKTFVVFMLVFLLAKSSSLAQLPILQITGLNGAGLLTWTNRLCTTRPVYEVQRAVSVTGAWEHVTFVSNQTSMILTNPLGVTAGTVFYRLTWVSDASTMFDYAFDEGYGFTAVTGRLSVAFFSLGQAGLWACYETGLAIDGRHPTGVGQLFGGAGVTTSGEERVRLYFTPADGDVFLEGTLEREEIDGQCVYSQLAGTVYEVTFADTEAIGTFVAVRSP